MAQKQQTTITYDPDWKPGAGFDYTDPWIGETRRVYPTGHPDKYPQGYFGASLSARIPYLPFDKRIEIYTYWAETARYWYGKAGTTSNLERAEHFESKVAELQSESYRKQEAARLLEHRAHYMDKLTPRDRAIVEADNLLLQAILEA